jgi:outer membrane protein assembly factor BamB
MTNSFGSKFVVLLAAVAALASYGSDYPQWRGPQRDGISKETGLLKEWPADGPKLLWKITDAGSGYAAPVVVGNRLYALGNEGIENEFVQALDTKDGKRVWQTRLGKVGKPDQQPKFPAARSTPTVDGDLLYALSSDGDLACVETATGKTRWQKNLQSDFGGKYGKWAYAESPLVDGDAVVCTPGGSTATLVALNKKTGEVIWKCAVPGDEEAAYTSVIVCEVDGGKQYVQMLQKGLAGVDAATGKLLWRYGKTVSRFGATIPTPVAKAGRVYSGGSGTGGGAVQIKGASAEEVYFSPKLPTAIGGSVLVGDNLYGTSQGLMCVDFATGNVKWEDKSIGAASICYADGMLFLHGENGQVALAEASPDKYREKGRFTPPGAPARSQPMEKAWAYPVVAGGCLYLRDHGALWCYAVK